MTLDDWLAFAPQLDSVYQQELQRSCYSDPQAFVNWTYHWREEGQSIDWIRDRIRESDEWKQKHGGDAPTPVSPVGPNIVRGTKLTRVTTDGQVVPRLYSYWANAWIDAQGAHVFCGGADGRPRFFLVNFIVGGAKEISPIGIPDQLRTSTTEGWYYDKDGWIHACVGKKLIRFDASTGESEVLMNAENADLASNIRLWQAHSSFDGKTHSATIQQIVDEGAYPNIGTLVIRNGVYTAVPAVQNVDESQITADGRWLLVKETDVEQRLSNRIIDLDTGDVTTLLRGANPIGHCDVGNRFIVGEDSEAGACVFVELDVLNAQGQASKRRETLTSLRRRTLFPTWNLGHVSVAGSQCLRSDETWLSLIDLQTGVSQPLIPHQSQGDPKQYDYQVRANLDPTGRVAAYTAYTEGHGYDLFLLSLVE